ncbi:MAG TPA: putative toxin-antitoxin system toxin component, PIN family [Anaerolineae bacterium]|nr:putative toxin-antitoxin system toxin component, PIN family [Anaerolineae bacterium]
MLIKATLDTNVLISGLISNKGAPRRIVDAWLADRFTLILSPYLIEELNRVLSYPRIVQRLRLRDAEVKIILTALLLKATLTPGALQLPGVTRDPKDDPVVACAQEGNADYIVSGDQDLLVLEAYEKIRIITPQAFAEILAQASSK